MKIKRITLVKFITSILLSASHIIGSSQTLDVRAELMLKTPGNHAGVHTLTMEKTGKNSFTFKPDQKLNVEVTGEIREIGSSVFYTINIKALDDIYFNFKQSVSTGATHTDCQFFMPGFWYRHNLRSPKEAPSFHTSDSWLVREDRLSSPLTGLLDTSTGRYVTVLRTDDIRSTALTALNFGEVILSGDCDLGFTGFENIGGNAWLSFGFPHREAPRSYIRKLTLAPAVTAFYKLDKGETRTLSWAVSQGNSPDFSDFVAQVWNYTFDFFKPQPVELDFSVDFVKETLSQFWFSSYVETGDLNYFSGIHLHIDDCKDQGGAEVGFIGRVLLNAYFAIEYAEKTNNKELHAIAISVLESYLNNGFTANGFFRESVNFKTGHEDRIYTIRRQSEGVYAILKYLDFEKRRGRNHPRWEARLTKLLDNFLKLQNADGSFPRKFTNYFEVVDKSGGSTPSATGPLVMASKYFSNPKYLASAKRSAAYVENEIIAKSDYFSSTLDANCEDKEAAMYAATAMWYLALVTNGKEHEHYISLATQATYFALSWFYLWDVPFAQGQMLGDIGLLSRGWGNVSVENNHIDVFIFEFLDVINYLAKKTSKPRFSSFAKVINTSMLQLLPFPGHMVGIAKTGFYPEVVQHTTWDYGRHGKGFYNDIFAPGWVVASLFEMLTPGRTESFFSKYHDRETSEGPR